MLKKLFLFVLVAFVGSSAMAQKNKKADPINWITLEEANEIAASGDNDKLFFVKVYADWCGWCHKMDKTTLGNKKIAKYMNKNFHMVKLNAEDKNTLTYQGKEYNYVKMGRRNYNQLPIELLGGRAGFPTVVFLDKDFLKLDAHRGYRDANDFMPLAEFYGTGEYMKKSFDMYLYDLENGRGEE